MADEAKTVLIPAELDGRLADAARQMGTTKSKLLMSMWEYFQGRGPPAGGNGAPTPAAAGPGSPFAPPFGAAQTSPVERALSYAIARDANGGRQQSGGMREAFEGMMMMAMVRQLTQPDPMTLMMMMRMQEPAEKGPPAWMREMLEQSKKDREMLERALGLREQRAAVEETVGQHVGALRAEQQQDVARLARGLVQLGRGVAALKQLAQQRLANPKEGDAFTELEGAVEKIEKFESIMGKWAEKKGLKKEELVDREGKLNYNKLIGRGLDVLETVVEKWGDEEDAPDPAEAIEGMPNPRSVRRRVARTAGLDDEDRDALDEALSVLDAEPHDDPAPPAEDEGLPPETGEGAGTTGKDGEPA